MKANARNDSGRLRTRIWMHGICATVALLVLIGLSRDTLAAEVQFNTSPRASGHCNTPEVKMVTR